MNAVLQFSTTTHLSSAFIRWGTWSWASHVDLVVSETRLLGAISGGVQYHGPNPDQKRAERYRVEVDAVELRQVLETQLGRPYDWQGILGLVGRRDWQADDSWFCSELIAWGFEQLGRPLVRADRLNRITPRDLLLSPLLHPVRI